MKRFLKLFLCTGLGIFFFNCSSPMKNTLSLDGQWTVKLDSLNVGEDENWAATIFEGTSIQLPGTLDDARIGTPNKLKPELNNYVLSNLVRKHQYIGKAWYQKEVEIPDNWKGKEIMLSLERVIWESTVYIDGNEIGKAESLIGSHEFDLTKTLSPGKHLLTFRIDNSNKYPLINVAGDKYPDPINQDMAHAYTNHTQIKWNGVLGEIALKVSDMNPPKNLQVYPNVRDNKIRITYEQDEPILDNMSFAIADVNGNVIFKSKVENPFVKNDSVGFEIPKPDKIEFWDEFNPMLYEAKLITTGDTIITHFGYRTVGNNKGELTFNGKRIFLRGNLECVIFPLTGYPPMQKDAWAQLIQQAKAYGLNHLRFHSWCPPKAAFKAADEAGFYYQVELPHWSLKVGEDKNTSRFLKAESEKILKDYGNHPSFILMSIGNELSGNDELMGAMVSELRKKDDRHLYTTSSMSFANPMGLKPKVEDDFFISQWTDKGWIRGQGIFNDKPPHFDADYSENSDHIDVPLISHEIGQYAVYPDMSEIPKYTGVLEPLNFIAVRNDLKKKELLDLADDFTNASGKLAALLYKEEIERALKTPSFDGFQLLQLQDFPGQGTALVGLLNAFWESKGVISAEDFKKFNSEVVPLIRFEKAVYKTGENFAASIEVANFYKEMLAQKINWNITDTNGNSIENGSMENVNLQIGNNPELGTIDFPINSDTTEKFTITVSLDGTEYQNNWSVWVYPKNVSINSGEVLFTSSMEKAAAALKQGRKVLLNPEFKSLKGIEGRFVPVFWSPVHFPNQPSTMGLLMNEKHPAFAKFPTSTHTDWQWWDLCIRSKSVSIDSLNVEPIVRVIDNFVTNRSLSNVFEAKVGSGKLVFSSIDLSSDLSNRPVARQLRHSLLEYMKSDVFNPSKSVKIEDLKKMRMRKGQGGFSTKDIYD